MTAVRRAEMVVVVAIVLITMGRGGSPGGTSGSGDGVTRITCYGGSEKEDFINDPDVKKILADKYHLEVDFIPKGSYKQVQIPPDELKSNKIDCLWPSSASAQAIFEGSGYSKAFGNDYEAASVLQSPEVLYANQEAADGLKRSRVRPGCRRPPSATVPTAPSGGAPPARISDRSRDW